METETQKDCNCKKKKQSQYARNLLLNNLDLEIFTINDFLTEEECDYLCSEIEQNSTRSQVAGTGSEASSTSYTRTSSTSALSLSDSVVDQITERMSLELDIPKENGEKMQGQLYEVGQEFKHHYDYFTDDAYYNHCLASGQRTYTFMVYLNDTEEGGETNFLNLYNYSIKPKKGMAVVWKNSNGHGTENPASLHAGMPVILSLIHI